MGEEFESGSFKPAKFEQALIAAAERFVPTSEKAEKMCRTQQQRYAAAYHSYASEYGDGRCYE